ncbi:uncharacterized protein PFL1_05116 [Pseudozyma flocculosa PF-1]|nr:uncharacterized protein PFL1_05116 [Pseudozyma flocculosa PF-1]EPQ27193.1 hypothetical protein PFL1_05116 [Pseudozyma flocculosa PF-1]
MVLTAAANQLRYPSSHTAYFSSLLVHLFASARDDAVREQITRVLLERLIVNRPHPWGLLVTFIELMRSHRQLMPKAPGEIQALLDHISSTLVGPGNGNGTGPGAEDGSLAQGVPAAQMNGIAPGLGFQQQQQQA